MHAVTQRQTFNKICMSLMNHLHCAHVQLDLQLPNIYSTLLKVLATDGRQIIIQLYLRRTYLVSMHSRGLIRGSFLALDQRQNKLDSSMLKSKNQVTLFVNYSYNSFYDFRFPKNTYSKQVIYGNTFNIHAIGPAIFILYQW